MATQLAQCLVKIDLPDTYIPVDAENWIANAVAQYFIQNGLPGNVKVTCTALLPGLSVAANAAVLATPAAPPPVPIVQLPPAATK